MRTIFGSWWPVVAATSQLLEGKEAHTVIRQVSADVVNDYIAGCRQGLDKYRLACDSLTHLAQTLTSAGGGSGLQFIASAEKILATRQKEWVNHKPTADENFFIYEGSSDFSDLVGEDRRFLILSAKHLKVVSPEEL